MTMLVRGTRDTTPQNDISPHDPHRTAGVFSPPLSAMSAAAGTTTGLGALGTRSSSESTSVSTPFAAMTTATDATAGWAARDNRARRSSSESKGPEGGESEGESLEEDDDEDGDPARDNRARRSSSESKGPEGGESLEEDDDEDDEDDRRSRTASSVFDRKGAGM